MKKSAHMPTLPSNFGATLTETLVVLAILGSLAALAFPAMSDWVLNQRLRGLAATYHSHVQWARSQAVQVGQRVYLKVESTAEGSCYIIYTGATAGCSCARDKEPCADSTHHLLSMHLPQNQGITVQTASASAYMAFDPLRGTTTPTQTVMFQSSNGNVVHQVTNLMGRTRSCSPNGFDGLKRC